MQGVQKKLTSEENITNVICEQDLLKRLEEIVGLPEDYLAEKFW